MWTLVLRPPRLLPKASAAGSPLLHQLHAGEPAPRCHLRSAHPSSGDLPHQPAAGSLRKVAPILPSRANGRSGWPWSPKDHTVPEDPATAHPYAISTVSRSAPGDDPSVGGLSPLFGATEVLSAPTARLLGLLVFSCRRPYTNSPTLQTRPSAPALAQAEHANRPHRQDRPPDRTGKSRRHGQAAARCAPAGGGAAARGRVSWRCLSLLHAAHPLTRRGAQGFPTTLASRQSEAMMLARSG
jgi:hypothetical protein